MVQAEPTDGAWTEVRRKPRRRGGPLVNPPAPPQRGPLDPLLAGQHSCKRVVSHANHDGVLKDTYRVPGLHLLVGSDVPPRGDGRMRLTPRVSWHRFDDACVSPDGRAMCLLKVRWFCVASQCHRNMSVHAIISFCPP